MFGAGLGTADNFTIQCKHTLSFGVESHFGTGQFGVSGDRCESVGLEGEVLGMMLVAYLCYILSCPLTSSNFHSSRDGLLS